MHTKATHTAGPWTVEGHDDDKSCFCYRIHGNANEFQGRVIADIWKHHDRSNKIKEMMIDEANARLIASAPELFELLEFIATTAIKPEADAWKVLRNWQGLVDSALAKVQGQ